MSDAFDLTADQQQFQTMARAFADQAMATAASERHYLV